MAGLRHSAHRLRAGTQQMSFVRTKSGELIALIDIARLYEIEHVDTIVVDRLKNQMVSTLRQAIDELSRIDCRQRPGPRRSSRPRSGQALCRLPVEPAF
jgi:hypothetical protein